MSVELNPPKFPVAYCNAPHNPKGSGDPFLEGFFGQGEELSVTGFAAPASIADLQIPKELGKINAVIGCVATATHLASETGFAVARAGGLHNSDRFSDIGYAVDLILHEHPDSRIFVVDTDRDVAKGLLKLAEEQNGRVVVFDQFCDLDLASLRRTDCQDYHPIRFDHNVNSKEYGQETAELIRVIFNMAKNGHPDFIFYISGQDITREEPRGGMNLSATDIVARDLAMFHAFRQLESPLRGTKTPIVMLPGGDFDRTSDKVYGKTARNLVDVFFENHPFMS